MSIDWRTELPHWLIIAGMFGLAFAVRSVPDLRVPLQWGISGEVNRYAEGPTAAFILPFFAFFVYVLLFVRATEQSRFRGVVRLAVTLLLGAAYAYSFVPLLA